MAQSRQTRQLYEYGFIDKTGNLVIRGLKATLSQLKDSAGELEFHNDRALVKVHESGLFHFIDLNGKTIQGSFPWAKPFSEGFAPVILPDTGLLSFIDVNGKVVAQSDIPDTTTYKKLKRTIENDSVFLANCSKFSEGLIAVTVINKERKYFAGYMDHSGRWQIKPQFSKVADFSNGLASINFQEPYPTGTPAYIDKCMELQVWISSRLDSSNRKNIRTEGLSSRVWIH